MADQTRSPEKAEAVRLGGLPFKVSSQEQASSAERAGGSVLSMPEAQEAHAAQTDNSYVDQNWGVAGKAGMGAFSGLTLGMGPGALSQMGAVDPGHLQAAQGSGWYTAGDVAGTMLPALLSGGESLGARGSLRATGLMGGALRMSPAGVLEMAGSGTERLLGGILGESTGVLGRLGSTPLKMAARGATEGALINMGHTVGDSMIQNKPLSAEAMAASGVDGALFGGLIGGSLGTVGSLSSMAVDSISSLGKSAVGRSGVREGLVFKRLGASAEDIAEAGTGAGGRSGYLKDVGTVLEDSGTGAKIGSSDAKLSEAFGKSKEVYSAARQTSAKELDELAAIHSPSLERISARFETEIAMPRYGTAAEAQTQRLVEKVKSELQTVQPRAGIEPVEVPPVMKPADYDHSTGKWGKAVEKEPGYKIPGVDWETPGSWAKWIETRDQMAEALKGVRGNNPLLATENQIRKEALHIIDTEIRASMEAASKMSGLEGIADKYAAATKLLTIADKMEETLGAKTAQKLLSTEPMITPRDLGTFVGMSAIGHPLSGATWLAAKGIGRKLQNKLEPAMAQMAYDASVGTRAASATAGIQASISKTVGNFFKTSVKVPGAAAKVYNAEKAVKRGSYKGIDRKQYEEAATRTEQLLSANHQDKLRRYAEGLHRIGYSDFASAIMDTNNRAVQYLMWNQPARQGAKQMNSLRPMPASKVPTLQEYKFYRIDRAIKDPMCILEDMEKGSLSRDAVKAVKYVYPELHAEIVSHTSQQIYQMKASGKTMPMSKIAMLGTALDAPVDSTLTPEYIGSVQTALNAPPAQPQDGASPDQGPSMMAQSMQTPLQRMASS